MSSDYNALPIDPQPRIGHVHLKVADLERSLRFYCGVLGFQLTQRYGTQTAFVSAGGYHHYIGLNTWESLGGSPPPRGATGPYHVAILYPTRTSLAEALRRLIEAGVRLDSASDHGVSEALYLRDPDDNGIELYWDRPRRSGTGHRKVVSQCTRGDSTCKGCLRRGMQMEVPRKMNRSPETPDLDLLFDRLSQSTFRRRFRLHAAERGYLEKKALETVLQHGEKFIEERLAPSVPPNDGK